MLKTVISDQNPEDSDQSSVISDQVTTKSKDTGKPVISLKEFHIKICGRYGTTFVLRYRLGGSF